MEIQTLDLLDRFSEDEQRAILAACEKELSAWKFAEPNSGPFIQGYEYQVTPNGLILRIDLRVVTRQWIDWRATEHVSKHDVRVFLPTTPSEHG